MIPTTAHHSNGVHIAPTLPTDSQGKVAQELILVRPGFLVRWGISIFFLILMLIGVICWFVQYPDVVSARAKLCAINSPKDVKVNVDGRLVRLCVQEGQSVQKGDMLGLVESIANPDQVLQLSLQLKNLNQLLNNTNGISKISLFSMPQYQYLGELQSDFQAFTEQLTTFQAYLPNGFYDRSKKMIEQDMKYLSLQKLQLESQKKLQLEDLNIAQLNFELNQKLQEDQLISMVEFRNEQSKILNKQLSIPTINTSIIANESQINTKAREIATLEQEINQQKNKFFQLFNTFNVKVEEWKKRFVLTAPIDGVVVFASFFQENQQLNSNQLFCYINPTNSQYFAEILIPQSNFGKVSQGQTVFLKFPAYPFQEFGSITGNIDFIATVASDSGYIAKVNLNNIMRTNYRKQIQYRNGLQAQAEIITKNMRLLERFYFNTVKHRLLSN